MPLFGYWRRCERSQRDHGFQVGERLSRVGPTSARRAPGHDTLDTEEGVGTYTSPVLGTSANPHIAYANGLEADVVKLFKFSKISVTGASPAAGDVVASCALHPLCLTVS